MAFLSWPFWASFALLFVLHYLLPHRFRWGLLLAASYAFYGTWQLEYLILLAAPTLLVYAAGRALDAGYPQPRRKAVFLGSLAALLGLLAAFKYLNFLSGLFQPLIAVVHGAPVTFDIALPVGISFFLFKLIGYLIDVYFRRIPAERHPGYLALYAAFFPQILAGPIERAATFIPELKKPVSFDWDRTTRGLQLISWGLFKKMVVADRLAAFVDNAFLSPEGQGLHLVLAAYLYAFQIYCDFSGYSDLAIGMTRLLGMESTRNFDHPYASRSIPQFWTRWHMTLSFWFRDYLFVPLSYAILRRLPGEMLLGVKVESWTYAVATMVTMLLCGLWHGASWVFVIWGGIHGTYLVASHLSRKATRRLVKRIGLSRMPGLRHALAVFLTFNLVSLAWIIFRSPTLADAWTYLSHIGLTFPSAGVRWLLMGLVLVGALSLVEYIDRQADRFAFLLRLPRPVQVGAFALFVCLIAIFSVDTGNEFIYSQF